MFNSFKKFKSKARFQAIFASILLGIGLSVATLAVMMVTLKIQGKGAELIHYGICGALAVLIPLILYFIFMPSDRRLAKRLDSLYTLDEKVSTMVELREAEGGFATLQREDADERLGKQPIKMLKSRQLVAGLLVFFISIVCFAGAWMLPVKADEGEPPIDAFDKQWLITAIGEIITKVEGSYINENLKEKTLTELNGLLDVVEESNYLSEMKAKAITVVLSINSALAEVNSAEALAVTFAQSQNEKITALAKEFEALSGTGLKKAIEALGKSLENASYDDANFVADEFNSYLASSGVRSDDPVYAVLKGLSAMLKAGSGNISDEFDDAGAALSQELLLQKLNRTEIDSVIGKLCDLFGITVDDLTAVDPDTDIDLRDPSNDAPVTDDSEVEEPENNMGSGGLGTGEVIYGSNDLVFDPDTNTYRPYGELLNEYFAKANEQITDGKTSDKITDAAEEYFAKLFGSSAGNDDNN